MSLDFDTFDKVEKDFDSLFQLLAITQEKIEKKLEAYSNSKTLKGNELVGWLGEIYTKIMFNGYLVDDNHEHDVETDSNLRISVKRRKGLGKHWTRTSAIPKIDGDECPTHLAFIHLNDDYSTSEVWLYPWSKLVELNRFKQHIVRGKFRSYYMSVNSKGDKEYHIYPPLK